MDQIVILAADADEIETFAGIFSPKNVEGFASDHPFLQDENIKFVKGIPNSPRGLEVAHSITIFPNSIHSSQAVDICFARCVVIIGNEYKPEPDSSGGNSWSFAQDEIKADLYIVLAALELDALVKAFIKSMEDANITDYKLPFVIQEVHNAANMTLLSDKYMSSAHKLWTSMNQRVPAAIIPGYVISSTHYDLPTFSFSDESTPSSLVRTKSFLRKVGFFIQSSLRVIRW
jgi:hypothetical protein